LALPPQRQEVFKKVAKIPYLQDACHLGGFYPKPRIIQLWVERQRFGGQ
jgi:hypothetical protein